MWYDPVRYLKLKRLKYCGRSSTKRVNNNWLTLFMKQNNTDFAWSMDTLKYIAKTACCLKYSYIFMLEKLPLGILLVMLQLILIQGLWLRRKWLRVLPWDIPQKMQGSTSLLFSKCYTSCLYCGTRAWAVTESNFCAVTSCSVVRSSFVKLQSMLKMVLTGFVFFNWLTFIPRLHHFPCLHCL